MGPSYNASAVVDHQLTDGAFKKQEQTLATSNDPSDALSAVVSAYDIASCAPTRCNVDLVLSQDGIQARYHVSMVWQSGDWLVDGAVDPGGARVPAPPAGFTNWAPGA